jgi:hypothetical protein
MNTPQYVTIHRWSLTKIVSVHNSIPENIFKGSIIVNSTLITTFTENVIAKKHWWFTTPKMFSAWIKLFLYRQLRQCYLWQPMKTRHLNMVVGFITTCAISVYHHQCCKFEPRSDEVYSIQHYVIKFVSGLRQVGGFLRVLRIKDLKICICCFCARHIAFNEVRERSGKLRIVTICQSEVA